MLEKDEPGTDPNESRIWIEKDLTLNISKMWVEKAFMALCSLGWETG